MAQGVGRAWGCGTVPPSWRVEVTPEVEAWTEACWQAIEAGRARQQERHTSICGLTAADRRAFLRFLGTAAALPGPGDARDAGAWFTTLGKALEQVLATAVAVPPTVTLKLLAFLDALVTIDGEISLATDAAVRASRRATGAPTLEAFLALLPDLGLTERQMVHTWIAGWVDPDSPGAWTPAELAPLFERHAGWVEDRLRLDDLPSWYWHCRPRAFRAAGMMRHRPASLDELLFAKALGTVKVDRERAQHALRDHPDRDAAAVAALTSKRFAVRSAAAQWVGRDRIAGAGPALEAALTVERHDTARAALAAALEQLGRSTQLDAGAGAREELTARAAKQAAAALPKALAWFPFDRLPAVHWARSTDVVAPQVLRWLLVQATRARTPEPDTVLRAHLHALDERDRPALGEAVLTAWIDHDSRLPSPQEALELARQHAARPNPWWSSRWGHLPPAELLENLRAYLRTVPTGSAIPAKGLLAVVAACGSPTTVAMARAFIEEHYGYRPAQGKALIAMLGWTDDPAAIQFLLAVRRRFRTASFRAEADRQVEALAARKGWSVDDLADRTLPTAGLDDEGRLRLDYGSRAFVAVLRPDLTLALQDEAGARLAALPAPRAADDAAAAAAARKALAAARKELKALAVQQRDRLFEAMCTGRTWRATDWQVYLAGHPVARHLVQRLVWTTVPHGAAAAASLRLLADGTLTDADEQLVTLEPDTPVRLAHDVLMSPHDTERWRVHLLDHQVKPLFPQLGRDTFQLPAALATAPELEDVAGVTLSCLTLRARATTAGWSRGENDHGAWFTTYVRRFPSAGLVAVLRFSGTELPERDVEVTLESLSFHRPDAGLAPLGEIPPVLLAECHRDVHAIAGSEFRPAP